MKNIFTILFLSIIGFAQAQVSVIDIEKELTKDFKRIKFWNDSLAKSKELFVEDSLDDAAIHFKNKLMPEMKCLKGWRYALINILKTNWLPV